MKAVAGLEGWLLPPGCPTCPVTDRQVPVEDFQRQSKPRVTEIEAWNFCFVLEGTKIYSSWSTGFKLNALLQNSGIIHVFKFNHVLKCFAERQSMWQDHHLFMLKITMDSCCYYRDNLLLSLMFYYQPPFFCSPGAFPTKHVSPLQHLWHSQCHLLLLEKSKF